VKLEFGAMTPYLAAMERDPSLIERVPWLHPTVSLVMSGKQRH
jgi:hypothetical protein